MPPGPFLGPRERGTRYARPQACPPPRSSSPSRAGTPIGGSKGEVAEGRNKVKEFLPVVAFVVPSPRRKPGPSSLLLSPCADLIRASFGWRQEEDPRVKPGGGELLKVFARRESWVPAFAGMTDAGGVRAR